MEEGKQNKSWPDMRVEEGGKCSMGGMPMLHSKGGGSLGKGRSEALYHPKASQTYNGVKGRLGKLTLLET